jgi:phospholipase/carboxylesterase
VIAAINALLPPLLSTLERVLWVQRHLDPAVADTLADALAPSTRAIEGPLGALEVLQSDDELEFMRARLVQVGRQTLELVTAFVEAARSGGDPFDLYRALRKLGRIQEALYPLAPVVDAVSRWFLEPDRRFDDALVERLREGAIRDEASRTGVLHADNERDERGGCSLYVPESWDGRTALPLVVALHGGHGHGRDFLWSWLSDARSRGVLLLAPTSLDRTWSLMGEDVDAEPLRQIVEHVTARYPVDRGRLLVTGMSDGATYALRCGARAGTPFTHLALLCGVVHPAVVADDGLERLRDRPVYQVHGARDWMFPVATARLGRDLLLHAGARLVYRELDDLSHTYPRDENPRILDWLLLHQPPAEGSAG